MVVGIVELFALLILARRMGVEEIHFWLNQLLPRIKIGAREPEEKGDQDAHPQSSEKTASNPPETQSNKPKDPPSAS